MKLNEKQIFEIKTARQAFEAHVQQITGRPVVANYTLADDVKQTHKPTVDEIIATTCNEMQVSVEQFHSRQRLRRIVDARRIAIKLVRELYPTYTLAEIGAAINNYDHTMIIYQLHQWQSLMASDTEFAGHYEAAKESLRKAFTEDALSVQAELQVRTRELKIVDSE